MKFKDADLIGCPIRVVVGARGLKDNCIEIKQRSQKDFEKTPVESAADTITQLAEKLRRECE